MSFKKLSLFGLGLFFINLVSAQYYYGGRGGGFSNFWYNLSPTTLLENEWVVFGGIFLIVFSMIYLGLQNFMKTKGKEGIPKENKGAVVVIAAVIALFSASALTQRALWYGYFGDTILNWIYVVIGIGLIFLLIPLYQGMSKKVGAAPAIFGILLVAWIVISFILDPYESILLADILGRGDFYYSYLGFWDFFSSAIFFWIFVVGLLISLVIPKGKSSSATSSGGHTSGP